MSAEIVRGCRLQRSSFTRTLPHLFDGRLEHLHKPLADGLVDDDVLHVGDGAPHLVLQVLVLARVEPDDVGGDLGLAISDLKVS